MKERPSTQTRILLAGMLPLALFAALLLAYLVTARILEQQAGIEHLGESYARELAAASRLGLFVSDTEELQRLAAEFVERDQVHSVWIAGQGLDTSITAVSHPGRALETRHLQSFKRTLFPDTIALFDADPAFDFPASADRGPPLGTVTVVLTTRDASRRTWALVLNGAALLLSGVLLGFMLLWRASRRIASPIGAITGLVRQAAEGNFEQRADTRASGELAELEAGVNGMMDALQRHREELEGRVEAATAELRLRNEQLKRAETRALRASRVKSEFLAHMSHELRTPMNGILGFSELLARSMPESAERSQVRFIRQSAQELLAVLDQILDFSRIESGRIELTEEPFAVRKLARSVCNLLQARATDTGIECSLRVGDQVPRVLMGDPMRIRQILSNLVSNAIKFAPGGSVRIGIDAEALPGPSCALTIVVEDTGIGIAEKDLQHIFDPFTQVDFGKRRHYQGTGLGLTIVKRLVDALKADIDVSSTPGKGSTFRVRLHLPVAGTMNDPVTHAAGGDERDDRRLAGLRILAVDDHRINRHLVRAMLEANGAEVAIAATGSQAITMAAEQPFDAVLMDIHMPGMGGIEASRLIQGLPGYEHVPIHIVSADAVSRNPIERELPEIASYLVKPLDEALLVRTIEISVLRPRDAPAPAAPTTKRAARARTGEAGTLAGEVVEILGQELPSDLETIERAFAARDWDQLRERLHALKGAAAVCSLQGVYRCVSELQKAVHDSDATLTEQRLACLHEAAADALKEVH